jgi:hypothetical protein
MEQEQPQKSKYNIFKDKKIKIKKKAQRSSNLSSRNSQDQFYNKNMEWLRSKQEFVQKEQEKRGSKELDGCRFHPDVSKPYASQMKAYGREPLPQSYQQLNEKKAFFNKDHKDDACKSYGGRVHERMKTITDKGSQEEMSATVQNEVTDTVLGTVYQGSLSTAYKGEQMSINTAELDSGSLGTSSREKRRSIVQTIHNNIQSLNTNTVGAKTLSSQQQTTVNNEYS